MCFTSPYDTPTKHTLRIGPDICVGPIRVPEPVPLQEMKHMNTHPGQPPEIRALVAGNKETPFEIWSQLLEDKHVNVFEALATRDDLTDDACRKIINFGWLSVRQALADNPHCPISFLTEFAKRGDVGYVPLTLMCHPNMPHGIWLRSDIQIHRIKLCSLP